MAVRLTSGHHESVLWAIILFFGPQLSGFCFFLVAAQQTLSSQEFFHFLFKREQVSDGHPAAAGIN